MEPHWFVFASSSFSFVPPSRQFILWFWPVLPPSGPLYELSRVQLSVMTVKRIVCYLSVIYVSSLIKFVEFVWFLGHLWTRQGLNWRYSMSYSLISRVMLVSTICHHYANWHGPADFSSKSHWRSTCCCHFASILASLWLHWDYDYGCAFE